ncbi:hypothetical protein PR048_025568 [Dryococelus australis]|uniref:Uncharacterized protein n=1 Tax=Dryococelus australis TaxID=614101 RepID=A0ABQ9GRR5_9NEOP|nr:hypothetical protein PR048_025568 [Dryococelus australis]
MVAVSGENHRHVESYRDSNTVMYLGGILLCVLVLAAGVVALCYCHRRSSATSDVLEDCEDSVVDPLSPKPVARSPCPVAAVQRSHRPGKPPKPGVDAVRMSALHGSTTTTNSYDRSHITGASSSTTEGPLLVSSSSLVCYPRETLNPPPSPATTADSTRRACHDDYCCSSSGASRFRPYRRYRTINQPPPPTPCSTDVCDESDSNYTYPHYRYYPPAGSENESDTFPPPPPTPRSQPYSEGGPSCPPSPSSTAGRSSTYFNPLPPPPSPVLSPCGHYDC